MCGLRIVAIHVDRRKSTRLRRQITEHSEAFLSTPPPPRPPSQQRLQAKITRRKKPYPPYLDDLRIKGLGFRTIC